MRAKRGQNVILQGAFVERDRARLEPRFAPRLARLGVRLERLFIAEGLEFYSPRAMLSRIAWATRIADALSPHSWPFGGHGDL